MSATVSVPFKPTILAESFFPSPFIDQEEGVCKFSLKGDKNDYKTIVDIVLAYFSSPDIAKEELTFSYKSTSGIDRFDKSKHTYYLSEKSITNLTKVCVENGLSIVVPEKIENRWNSDKTNRVRIVIPAEDSTIITANTLSLAATARANLQKNTQKFFEKKREELSLMPVAGKHKFSYKLEFPSSYIGKVVQEQMETMLEKQGWEASIKGEILLISEIGSPQARIVRTLEEEIRQNPLGEYKLVFSSSRPIISANEILDELRNRVDMSDEYRVFMTQEGDNYEITACQSSIFFDKMATDLRKMFCQPSAPLEHNIPIASYTKMERMYLEQGLESALLKFVEDGVNQQITVTNPYSNQKTNVEETPVLKRENSIQVLNKEQQEIRREQKRLSIQLIAVCALMVFTFAMFVWQPQHFENKGG